MKKFANKLHWFQHYFANRFYLEIQPEDQDEQKILNQKLYTLSQQTNIPLVATGDSHYVSPEDRDAHEVMLSIQTHGKIDDPNRYSFGNCRVHLRSADDMLALFPDHEQAIWNSGEIADSCDFDFETDKLFFPNFAIPKQHTPESYFKELCEIGLKLLHDRGAIAVEKFPEYQARLQA